MAEKEIYARVQQKRDTSANWTSADPILKNGEIILVDTAEGELRLKVGDGVKRYTQLPFNDEALRSLINAKGGKGNSFSITLLASNWVNKEQSVNNAKFKSNGHAYLVQPIHENKETYDAAEIYADDITVDGKITFHATGAPAANIAVDVLQLEVM
jgi:hypothetical protein